MIVAGLSWWQAWLCVWLGYTISACFIVLSGRIGATYHIGFPVIGRASFGIWGSLWPVFNRAAMGKGHVHNLYFPLSSNNGLLIGRLSYLVIYSLYLVWSPSLYRWSLCLSHDPVNLEVVGSRRHAG